jgi:DNA repair protein RadC
MFDAGDVARVRRLCQEIYGAGGSERAAPFPNPAGHGRNEFAEAATAPHYFGHRERLLAAGTENLADYELLEVILFAGRPRGDVKPVAKALIEHFGGLAQAMAAAPDELAGAGLNRAGIAAIKAAREAALRLMRCELQEQPVVSSWDRLIDYCTAHVANNKVEETHILFLDRKNVLIRHEPQQRGTIDHTPGLPARGRQARARAWRRRTDPGAQQPLGRPDPVHSRHHGTKDIKKAAASLGVVLHDHVVIG